MNNGMKPALMASAAATTVPTMIRAERCEKCKWSATVAAEKTLYCRRNPPTAVIVPGPGGRPTTLSTFPPTKPTDWCGEFRSSVLA